MAPKRTTFEALIGDGSSMFKAVASVFDDKRDTRIRISSDVKGQVETVKVFFSDVEMYVFKHDRGASTVSHESHPWSDPKMVNRVLSSYSKLVRMGHREALQALRSMIKESKKK